MKKDFSAILANRSSEDRNHLDFYPTPPSATIALMRFLEGRNLVNQNHKIWEPACGSGDMTLVLRKLEYDVTGTDIETGHDYLVTDISEHVNWVITNPPFSLASQFIRRSLENGVSFAFLLKSQYWHSANRLGLFMESKPSFVLPLTWRIDFKYKERGQGTESKGSPTMDHIWVVWLAGKPNYVETIYQPLEKPIRNDYEWYLSNHHQ
jgi:hypothetical protein